MQEVSERWTLHPHEMTQQLLGQLQHRRASSLAFNSLRHEGDSIICEQTRRSVNETISAVVATSKCFDASFNLTHQTGII